MPFELLKPGVIITGPVLPEPVKVITIERLGDAVKVIGQGLQTNQIHQPILTADQVQALRFTPEKEPFDSDLKRLVRLTFPNPDTSTVKMLFAILGLVVGFIHGQSVPLFVPLFSVHTCNMCNKCRRVETI